MNSTNSQDQNSRTGQRGTGHDAIVVGGGLIGLTIAWELNRRGLRPVVFERDLPGAATTSVAAGMLAPVGELDFGEPDLLELNLASARLYPDFVASVEEAGGLDAGHMECGALHVALDRDEAGELRRISELQRGYGLESTWLGPGATRDLEPGVSPSLAGSILVEGDAVVDPRALVAALLPALESAGVEVRSGSTVEELLRPDGQPWNPGQEAAVGGVRLQDGTDHFAPVVIAAPGADAGRAEWLPDEVRPPVRPVKGQVVELRGSPGDPVISRIVGSERVYLSPRRDGRIIIGATVEEMGFDARVTAGGVHELLREAYRLLPEIAELEFVTAISGFRPGTPDNLPVIGKTSIDGLILATGHYRNGILLAPVSASIVSDLVTGRPATGPGRAADPARFQPNARSPRGPEGAPANE
ncbi:MAG: glycine oxidase ThiO [Actinomycetota bacterium]|nr:glycine oxidase ThiO [Actinomycetota bacterium]